jgi:hypothetical protein
MSENTISAQRPTSGKKTTGGSAGHDKMKFSIPKGKGPASTAACADNKKMYKSKEGASNSKMSKSSY